MKTPLALPLMLAGTRRSAVAGAEGGVHAGRDVAAAKGKPGDFASALAEASGAGADARAVGDKPTIGAGPPPQVNRDHTVFAKDATREPSVERRIPGAAAVTPKRATGAKVPNPGARQSMVIAERAKPTVAESSSLGGETARPTSQPNAAAEHPPTVAQAGAAETVAGPASTVTTTVATVATIAAIATSASRPMAPASERRAGAGQAGKLSLVANSRPGSVVGTDARRPATASAGPYPDPLPQAGEGGEQGAHGDRVAGEGLRLARAGAGDEQGAHGDRVAEGLRLAPAGAGDFVADDGLPFKQGAQGDFVAGEGLRSPLAAEGDRVAVEGFSPHAPLLTDLPAIPAEKPAAAPRWSTETRQANASAPPVQTPEGAVGKAAAATMDAVPPAVRLSDKATNFSVQSGGPAVAALHAQPAGVAAAALSAPPVPAGSVATAALLAKPEGRPSSPPPAIFAGKPAASALSPAVATPTGSSVSPVSPAGPATSPVPPAPLREVRAAIPFVSPAPKGQASPPDRSRSVLAPAAPELPSTGSIGSLFAGDKGGEKIEKIPTDSPRATAEAKAAASASRPGRLTPPPADRSDAQESDQDQPSPSEGEPASGSAAAAASNTFAATSPERASQVNPLAAGSAVSMAAPMAEANPRSGNASAANRSAAFARTGPLAAATSRFTNDASAPASLPGFSTVAAASHDKGAPHAASARSHAPASATDGATTPATGRAAASARAAPESGATAAAAAPHSSAVAPLATPPEALAAAKPITVDAGTLGAHLSSQSLSLSPGAHLPALFEAAPAPTPAGTFWAQAAEDPSLHGALMNDAARVSLDAGAAGEITLHLRIKDGVADVRFEGTAAQTLEIRPQELRVALASEGLSLGGFESGQSTPRDGQLESERRDSTPPPTPVSDPARAIPVSANRAPASAVALGGRLHVTA